MSNRRRALAALAAGVLGFGMTAAPAFAATTTWTFTVANANQSQYSRAIACPDELSCVAVGVTYADSGGARPSIDVIRSHGASHITPALPPDAARDAVLSDIACPLVDTCIAVGSYSGKQGYDLPLLETSTGSGADWTPRGLHLLAQDVSFDHIACAGDYCAASGAAADGRPILMRSDAGHWVQVPIDVPSGWSNMDIVDVGCTGDGPCYAFGSLSRSGQQVAMAIRSTSTGPATVTRLPSPVGAGPDIDPKFFSCYTGGCVGLSQFDSGTKIAAVTLADGHWAAARIVLPGTIRANPPLYLGDLSCNVAGSTCAAIGVYGRDDPELGDPWIGGVILTRTDGTWRATKAPLTPGSKAWSPELISVSCTANDTCAASGTSRPDAHYSAGALVESYSNGVWTPQDLGVPEGAPTGAVPSGGIIGCSGTSCVGTGGYTILDSGGRPDGGGPAWVRTRNLGG